MSQPVKLELKEVDLRAKKILAALLWNNKIPTVFADEKGVPIYMIWISQIDRSARYLADIAIHNYMAETQETVEIKQITDHVEMEEALEKIFFIYVYEHHLKKFEIIDDE